MPNNRTILTGRRKAAKELQPVHPRPLIAFENLESRYKRLKTLTDGALNEGVWIVERIKDGKLCVQKKIPFDRKLLREIDLLHDLEHPNVINYVDAYILQGNSKDKRRPGEANLFTEFCDLGSLDDLMGKYLDYNEGHPNRPLYPPEWFVWHVFLSLAKALQYIHFGLMPKDSGPPYDLEDWPTMLHRDIKPANVFLRSSSVHYPPSKTYRALKNHPPKIVLGDFGMACVYGDADWEHRGALGTFCFQGPEFPDHSTRGDVYSVGMTILSLCNLLPCGPMEITMPPGVSFQDWSKAREARRGIHGWGLGEAYSLRLEGLVKLCLRPDKERRPESFELVGLLEKDVRRCRFEDEPIPGWAFKRS